MKVKLQEAVWKHHIEQGLANKFRTALTNDDVDGAVALSIELLDACKAFFGLGEDLDEQDNAIDEINELITSFEDVEHEYNAVDSLLDDLYDFCDEHNIWIPLPKDDKAPEEEPKPEEPAEAEPEETPAEPAPAEPSPEESEEDKK